MGELGFMKSTCLEKAGQRITEKRFQGVRQISIRRFLLEKKASMADDKRTRMRNNRVPTDQTVPNHDSEALTVKMPPIIEVDHISKNYSVFRKKEGFKGAVQGLFKREYNTVEAVKDISFSIESGEFVAFLGPNGAGKTTT